jgi:hypothetical protein
MIIRIEIHVPDVHPDSPEAVRVLDSLENDVEISLRAWDWWFDVENGETRYMPENVSELS